MTYAELHSLLPVVGAAALCALSAWGFVRLGGRDGGDGADGSDRGEGEPIHRQPTAELNVDPWQLAVGCVIVTTLVAWYSGLTGA